MAQNSMSYGFVICLTISTGSLVHSIGLVRCLLVILLFESRTLLAHYDLNAVYFMFVVID